MTPNSATPKHTRITRIFHAGLATAVFLQLVTSLVMQGPKPTRAGDWLFSIHTYGGLAAMALVAGFWAVIAVRRFGTDVGLLVPWFTGGRRGALWQDAKTHVKAFGSLRLPEFDPQSPFAAAIHGLGLLLMTGMATSGTIFYLGAPTIGAPTGVIGAVIDVHRLFANLVWAYLIGHGALAVIHHYAQHMSLREMWSLQSQSPKSGTDL